MEIYLTIPILNSVKDTLGSNCIGWYGVQYKDTAHGFTSKQDTNGADWITDEQIKNSDEVKRFINQSMMKFDNLNINQFLYLDRISKTESDYDDYVSAIKNNAKYDTKSDIVLLPCNEPLAERANDNLIAALTVFGIGSLLFLIMVIFPKLKSEDVITDIPNISPPRYRQWL